MSKHVLMIAYHFPPISESSGLQRTLAFAKYLASHGWSPVILSINPRAYPNTSADQLKDIPPGIPVYRAFGLDTARHLAVAGRYPRFLALPDRFASWLFGGVWSGMRIIRKYKPVAIWSTYPIATAHRIGGWLQRLSGLPWIADFRDPMAQQDYPVDPATHRAFVRVEEETIRRCRKAVFATPGARELYAARYPAAAGDKFEVILNGYDEAIFQGIDASYQRDAGRPLRLIHSGVLYPSERDPVPFFRAVSRLKADGVIAPDTLQVVLRATGNDEVFSPLLAELDISDIVRLEPRIGYREALQEMVTADGLLLFQAANCNQQIPAKAYEYLRAQRPILALTDPQGDTAATLRDAGAAVIARLDDEDAIYKALDGFIETIKNDKGLVATSESVARFERAVGAERFRQLLEEVEAEMGSS